MTRALPEWIGKTPDTAIPARVRVRVFERFGGICQETGRKIALIATGFCQSYTLDCGANATAQRVLTALRAAEAGHHGYAIGQVRGPVVTIWTPESQSVRAMGGKRFQESKSAIMDWIAAQIGVTAEQLANGRAA